MNDKFNSEMLHHLEHDGKRVILIGTAHVSRESVDLVEAIIADVKPDTVCVELCEGRAQSIRQKDRWQEMDIIKVIKEKKAFLLLSNLMLASFQKRIANRLEVAPGQEMIQAMDSAETVGAAVHLADRDIRITLSRTWRSMGLWGKIKLLFQLILSLGEVDEISEADVEKMKQQDMLASILDEVGKSMPQVRTCLIDERDRYLTEKIRSAPGQTIVAVVGAGHVPGIKQYWDQPIDINALETLPPKGPLPGFLKWFIPFCICTLIIYGFFPWRCQRRCGHGGLVDSGQRHTGRPGCPDRPGPPADDPLVHSGGAVDLAQPHDCRGVGVRPGGGFFPQAQGKRFRKSAHRYPVGQRLLAQ